MTNRDESAPDDRSRQINAAIAQFLEAAELGTPLDKEAFLARHFEIAGELREFLGDQSAVRGVAPVVERDQAGSSQTIVASCPNGHRLRIASRLAGQRCKCPKCQAPFVVPEAAPECKPGSRQGIASETASVTETVSFKHARQDDTSSLSGTSRTGASGAPPNVGQRFGQFELVELLGEGGFGAVFRPQIPHLDRDVALKLPRPGSLGDREQVARFLREAQAAAQLHHPNIVSVHDAGQIDGTYYIASAYIAGKSLRQHLDERKLACSSDAPQTNVIPRRIDFGDAAALVSQLATALNYAHQKGIFHRDVKPANILVDANGQPHLMDFGLARRMEGDTLRTTEGIRMGTPAYMSPEQAKGDSHLADSRSDLWSLGVVLFELLTGELPFASQQMGKLLDDILHREPDAPRKLNRSIPRDLDTICLKCLAKEPVRRYPTCQHLADELERWLKGEPIAARRISKLERSWRWAKRRPAVAALSTVLLLVFSAVVIIAPIVAVQQSLLRKEAGELLAQKAEVVQQLDRSLTQRDQSITERDAAIKQQKQLINERESALARQREATQLADQRNTQLQESLSQRDAAVARLRPQLAEQMFERAAFEYQSGRVSDALALLEAAYDTAPVDHPLRSRIRRLIGAWLPQSGVAVLHSGAVQAVTYSPDGRMFATGSADHTVGFWDAQSGAPLGDPLKLNAPVVAVAFSPDGKSLAVSCEDCSLELWSVETRRRDGRPFAHSDRTASTSLAFSRDGSRLLTAYTGGFARLWSRQSRAIVGEGEEWRHSAVSVSGSGGLFSIDQMGRLQSWNVTTGKAQQKLLEGETRITSFDCSRDGRTIVTGTYDGQLQLWDLATAARKGPGIEHNSRVSSVVLSPDGKTFVAGFEDNTAQIWSTQTYTPQGAALRTRGPVTSVAYSPDGRFVLTGSTDGVARIWETRPLNLAGRTIKSDKVITAVAMSPDGQKIATGGADGLVRVWNASSGELIGHPLQSEADHAKQIVELTFSPDGLTLTSTWYEEERSSVYFPAVRLWNLETQEPIGELLHLKSTYYNSRPCAAFSLDGHVVASAEVNQVQIWNTETGHPQSPPIKQAGPFVSVAIGPDCQTLAIGNDDRSMRFWNVATGQPIGDVMRGGSADVVAFSRNGQLVLAGGDDASARLWQVPSGRPFGKPLVHGGKVLVVGFSADGHTALTAGNDQTCKLWDVATCEPAGEPLLHDNSVSSAVFSSDGKTVMTVCNNGTMRLWDAASCKPLSWPIVMRDSCRCKFSPDGSLVLVALGDTVELWRVPHEIADDAEFVKDCVESAAALRVTEHGAVERVPYDQWLAARMRLREFQQKSNTPATPAP